MRITVYMLLENIMLLDLQSIHSFFCAFFCTQPVYWDYLLLLMNLFTSKKIKNKKSKKRFTESIGGPGGCLCFHHT